MNTNSANIFDFNEQARQAIMTKWKNDPNYEYLLVTPDDHIISVRELLNPALSGWWKDFQRNFREVIKQPTTILAVAGSAAMSGALGSTIQNIVTKVQAASGKVLSKLFGEGRYKEVEARVRAQFQAAGVIPTNDQVARAIFGLESQYVVSPWANVEKYLPWALGAFVLILALRKNK